MSADIVAIVFFAVVLPLMAIIVFYYGFIQVQEKQSVILEFFGKFYKELTPGIHFFCPFATRPKYYKEKYYVEDPKKNKCRLEQHTTCRISLQNEVLDFPKQHVITLDNASISLDAVLNFRIDNAKTCIYNIQNLPNVLSKLLQAHLRNVAATLSVDQLIEESAHMAILERLMNDEAMHWGVRIDYVKISRVEAGELNHALAKARNADLNNKQIIINAKADKQTMVIEAEGARDSCIKEAEGLAQNLIAKAKGDADATLNLARAEAKKIAQIAPSIKSRGEDPIKYILSLSYIQMLKNIAKSEHTEIEFVPESVVDANVVKEFGLNTIFPPIH